MQDRVRAARVVDRLLVPDKIFGLACPCVRLSPRLYLALRGFIAIVGGEDQGEREDGSRDEGKEIWLIEGKDVVPFEIGRAERMGDGVEDVWVGLEGDVADARGVRHGGSKAIKRPFDWRGNLVEARLSGSSNSAEQAQLVRLTWL